MRVREFYLLTLWTWRTRLRGHVRVNLQPVADNEVLVFERFVVSWPNVHVRQGVQIGEHQYIGGDGRIVANVQDAKAGHVQERFVCDVGAVDKMQFLDAAEARDVIVGDVCVEVQENALQLGVGYLGQLGLGCNQRVQIGQIVDHVGRDFRVPRNV